MSLVEVGGIRFRIAGLTAITSELKERQRATKQIVLGYANPHVINVATSEPEVSRHLQACDFVCVDGIGVQLALKLRHTSTERLPAHHLLDHLLDSGLLTGRLLVIGIEEEYVVDAARKIVARSPGLHLVGTSSGFASDSDVRVLLREHCDAEVVLIGAGSPRSESISNMAADVCKGAIVFHCGAGSLAVYAGVRSHAPRWVNRVGLDWLYRFVTEPHTRRRYTIGALQFTRSVLKPNQIVLEISQKGKVAS